MATQVVVELGRAPRGARPVADGPLRAVGGGAAQATKPRALARIRARAQAVVELLRPREWPKNLLVAVPLLFSPQLVSGENALRVVMAVLVLALLSAVAYGINDALDRHADRGDPRRRARPLAAGRLSPAQALAPLGVLLVVALLAAAALGTGFAVVAALFLAAQGCYSLGHKRVVALDVVLLALLLVLRIDAGAVAIGVAAGPHFLVLMSLLAMFVTLCRRRREIVVPLGRSRLARQLARRYLDVVISALLCGLVVGHVLVVGADPGVQAAAGPWVYATTLFVLSGLLRFWHLTVVEERPGGTMALLYGDRWLAFGVAGWLASILALLHL